MPRVLKTVLLLALPASGKSEVRRYLDDLSLNEREGDFHMGETVQLDDFPYVHLMRRIDDEIARLGRPRIFFEAPERSFRDGRDWGTLIELLNEDHEDLVNEKTYSPKSAAHLLFERLDAAGQRTGIEPRLAGLDERTKMALKDALEKEAKRLLDDKFERYTSLEGKTLVVEFARGGKDKSAMPLEAPFGYRYALSRLSPALIEGASILYVWVTPEESRRKNAARTDPNDPGSILHHGVPLYVMLNDYGCDDIDWLESTSSKPGTVEVDVRGRTVFVPIARFDNRVDKTSFIREPREKWKSEEIRAVHQGLAGALSKLAAQL
jgi:hypothetical protein